MGKYDSCGFAHTNIIYIVSKIHENNNWADSWVQKVTDIEPLYNNIWSFSNKPLNATTSLIILAIFIVLALIKKKNHF